MAKGYQIKGDKNVLRMLRELPKRVGTKVNRRAVNLATTPIVQAAKSRAAKDEGDLRRAITKKVYNRGMQANGIVGVDADYVSESGKRPVLYDHLVEYGHQAPDGSFVPAHPWLRPAWDESIATAQAKYESELAAGVEREAAAAAAGG